ncbi:MAG: serine/threonine-protein kinase [Cyanobacteria bacterium J06631_2]
MKQASSLPKIAGYQIEQLVGQGSFALVYAARDLEDLRQPQRALLELIVQGDHAEQHLRRRTFKRTAEILEKFRHSSIPQVYSLFEHEAKLYLVQEFIAGTSYSQYLDGNNSALSINQIEAVFWQVLDALAQLHRAKIVHRDIKPSNLMRRDEDGSTVIIDFGSACDLSTLSAIETTIGDRDERLGRTRIYTPGYAHPEQRDGLVTATAQWDLYALAKTIVALRLGSNPPWKQPWSISELGFSDRVSKLLEEMLNTEGCQLIDADDAIKLESASNFTQTNTPSRPTARKKSRNRSWLVWGGLGTALAAAATGIYFLLPESTGAWLGQIQIPFVPRCPNYVKNELNLPLPDRGFAGRFYYPENSTAADSSLDVLQSGNLIAQATSDVKGFIWIKSLADGSSFPPGNYTLRLNVPESLPYETDVTLDTDFPVTYLGGEAAIEVGCALDAPS